MYQIYNFGSEWLASIEYNILLLVLGMYCSPLWLTLCDMQFSVAMSLFLFKTPHDVLQIYDSKLNNWVVQKKINYSYTVQAKENAWAI